MAKIFTNIPNDELMAKIIKARDNIRNKTSRDIKCPHCKHTVFSVYADSTGYIETKCRKCKQPVLIDLVSMRRMNRK